MGTHSLIIMRVKGKDGSVVIWTLLFQTLDGDLVGVGQRLFSFLKNMKIMTGIPIIDHPRKMANGPGDLFAQIIALFKGYQVGSAYIQPVPSDGVIQFEEYTYSVDIEPDGETITVAVLYQLARIFRGTAADALTYFKLNDDCEATPFGYFAWCVLDGAK
jgi:hypothetical protein